MRNPLLPALFAGLFLVACGGSSDPKALTDEGVAQLNSGDHAAAQETLWKALQGMEATDPQFERAKMSYIQALIPTDPDKAMSELLALAKAQPALVDADVYLQIGSAMIKARQFTAASKLLDAGKQAYPDNAEIAGAIDQVIAAAEAAGDEGALESLKGLGYIGE